MLGPMRGIAVRAAPVQLSYNAAITLFVLAMWAACAIALISVGVSPLRPFSYLANGLFYVATWFMVGVGPYLRQLYKVRPESPFAFTRTYLGDHTPALREALPLLGLLALFMPMFSAMKASIPLFTAYTWDGAFIAADRAIFGQDAWTFVQPVLGFPPVTSALSIAYHLWILLIYAGGVYFAIYQREVGKRYFVAYFPLWIVGGVVMATAFASVGPCFVGPLLGQGAFDAQMAYLNSANENYPVLVLRVQQILLDWHTSGDHGLGRGITAMPSMHVGLACLFWLAMRQVNKWAGRLFFAFYVVIFVGSVHLAYHYAVDGIVATALACVLWWASGKVTR